MKNYKLYLLFSCLLFSSLGKAQLVKEDFNEPLFQDQFDDNKNLWPVMVTKDNFFIVQNGEYLVTRNVPNSEYALFSSSSQIVKNYKLETSLAFTEEASTEAYCGVMFLVQSSGGGYVVEINNSKKYRVRQLKSESYSLLTGNAGNGGWVKTSTLKNKKEFNIVKIKVMGNSADIYFTGLIIGPLSNARIDFFNLYSKIVKSGPSKSSNDSLRTDTKVLEGLVREIESLRKENEEIKSQLNNTPKAPSEQELIKSINVLQDQLTEMNSENEALRKEIQRLKEQTPKN
jgi:hypothetical protein